jgi:undecaprenyl-diphosphatase
VSARPALVSALSAGAAYVATAVATFSGVFGQVDIDTLRFSESKDSYSLDLAGSVLSTLGGLPITLAATLILALIWTLRDGLRGAAPLGIAIVIVVGLLTQRLMPQPGPPLEALRDFHWLALSSGDNLSPQAFPSGHVARTTFLALLYAGRHPRTLPLMALLVGAMAVSRIYIGSHWTSDVLGGLLLGAAVALSLIALRSNLVPRAPA